MGRRSGPGRGPGRSTATVHETKNPGSLGRPGFFSPHPPIPPSAARRCRAVRRPGAGQGVAGCGAMARTAALMRAKGGSTFGFSFIQA